MLNNILTTSMYNNYILVNLKGKFVCIFLIESALFNFNVGVSIVRNYILHWFQNSQKYFPPLNIYFSRVRLKYFCGNLNVIIT